jgi:hypothetical protein
MSTIYSPRECLSSPGFAYSKIDMNLNGGLGDVSQKNVILNNVRNADCLTGIKHANGHDWWVISKYSNLNVPILIASMCFL